MNNKNQNEQSYLLNWNMNGFYHKYAHLQEIINKYNPTFFALNETRHHQRTNLNFPGYQIIQKSGTFDINDHAHGGVAIMIKDNVGYEEINLNTNLQVVAIKVLFPQKMTIAAIYIPPNLSTIPTEAELDELADQLPNPFMLIGDVNSRHVNLLSPYTNSFGNLIMNFVYNNDLAIINDDKETRVGTHGEGAMIDLVMVTGELTATFEVETTEDFYGSDHKLIKVNTVQKLIEIREPNYNYNKAEWKKFAENTKLNEINIEDNIENINTKMKTKIINAADISIPKFCPKFNSERCKAWWSKEINKEYKIMNQLNREMRRLRSSPGYNPAAIEMKKSAYYNQRSIFYKLRDENRKLEMEKTCLRVTKDTTNSELWKKIRAHEGKRSKAKTIFIYEEQSDTCITDKKEIAEKLSVIFLDNFKNDSVIEIEENPTRIIDESQAEYLNDDFTMNEMKKQIRRARNTCPGKDKISYAMIKNLSEEDMEFLLKFYNVTWNEGRSPNEWKKSIIIPIPKEIGFKHNIRKFRPIQLCSVFTKIKENMVASRLNYHMEMNNINHENQFGFRAKRSTKDNLIIFEDRVRTAIEQKYEVVAIFFDLEKAFDSVKSKKIIEKLKEMGIHGKFLQYSKDFFTERKYQVRFDGELSSEKSQDNGVPQGSGLSVQFFKIVMDQMKNFINTNDIIIFVDDFVYLKVIKKSNCRHKNRTDIQNDINKIEKWADTFGLKISSSKTKIMKFTLRQNSPDTPKIKINNNEIEEVKSFKFLGVIYEKDLKYTQHINYLVKRIDKDLNVIKYLASYKLNISREALLHVLDAKVKSKIEYVRYLMQHESKARKNKLKVKYNEGLRICLGALRTTHIDTLYAEAGKIDLESSALKSTMKYVVNVLGNSENPVRKRIFKIIDEISIEHRAKKESILKIVCAKLIENNLINIQAVKPFFLQPQWTQTNINIDKSVHIFNKSSQSFEVWQKIYADSSSKYDKNNIIFTDGSLREERVSYAVTDENNLIKSGRINDKSTIMTAEMRGIIEAVYSSESENPIIATDSLSTVEMLEKMNEKNNSCRYIANLLKLTNKNITIMWIPSHQKIKGNETADKFAGDAININECDERITENDAKKYIDKIILEEENEKWRRISEEKNLRKLKDNIEILKFPKDMIRKDQVIITRLRTGYTKYTDEWKFHTNEGAIGQACEHCECFTSVYHIFAECELTEDSRRKYNIKFKDLNNVEKFNDIIAFLKDIKLYEKI